MFWVDILIYHGADSVGLLSVYELSCGVLQKYPRVPGATLWLWVNTLSLAEYREEEQSFEALWLLAGGAQPLCGSRQ